MTLHRTPIIGALVGVLLAVAPNAQAQKGGNAFVVEDYGDEVVRVSGVARK
jgi:hypothetical protein